MRRCALGLALLSLACRVGAQQSDEERIAELEEELEALREAARGRLSCTAEGGFVSITPIEDAGGDVTGYTITNVTAADDAGLTVLEVALSDQDTDVVLPGMVVRISRASGGSSEADPYAGGLAGGMDVWGVIGGNVLTWLFGCVLFGIVVVLEKKYRCIGGEKLHGMVEQHHTLQRELKDVIHVIKGKPAGGASGSDATSMVVEGAPGGDLENGAVPGGHKLNGARAAAAGFAGAHKADLGQGAGLAAQLARAKNGDAGAKRMLAAGALGQVRKMEDMSPEEMMERGRNAAHKGSEAFHKVADDERTQQALATGKQKANGAAEKANKGRFGRKAGGGKESGTKFQNPMLGRASMTNPMRRSSSSPRASSDKSQSLLASELTVADDSAED